MEKYFYEEMKTYLVDTLGFKTSSAEPCFSLHQQSIIIIGLYVYDLIITGPQDKVEHLIKEVKNKYNIHEKIIVNDYVGCEIKVIGDGYFLHQHTMIDKLLTQYKDELKTIKPTMTPLPTHYHITCRDTETPLTEELQTRYQSGVGSLLYLIKHTRPDISNAVRELSKAMDKADSDTYKSMLRVMRYVETTRSLVISINKITNKNGRYMVFQMRIGKATRTTENPSTDGACT